MNKPAAKAEFSKPESHYKPKPFWHINGEMTDEGIIKQLADTKKTGFTGVALSN